MKLSRLCLSLLFALIGFAAWAEPPGDDRWVEHMKKTLNLTEQQVGELKKIHEETKTEREALREQHRALHQKMAERLKGVLTEEQRKKFDEMHERRMKGGHGMGGMGGMGGMHGGGMDDCPMQGAGGDMSGCPGHGEGAAGAKPGKPGKHGAPAQAPAAPAAPAEKP